MLYLYLWQLLKLSGKKKMDAARPCNKDIDNKARTAIGQRNDVPDYGEYFVEFIQ